MDSLSMLNNIIKYYKNVSNRALTNLANGKGFQFGRALKNKSLEVATLDHYQKIHNSKKANELMKEYQQAMKKMSRLAQNEYNRYLTMIKSTDDTVFKQKLLNDIANRGFHGFTAKNGARWNIESYSHMFTRHVNNELIRMNVLENSENELFQVSTHNTICDLCKPFEGRILTRVQIDNSTLFHPNCKHFITPYGDI
jgi:hypothetical protein